MEHPQSGEARLNVLQAFETLPDPRTRECAHRLDELLLVALCAITSGADSWVTVAEWGCMKLDWLRRFLPFANAIASHDTFSRVFALLDARRFEACFLDWMQQLCPTLQGQLVNIDGKSVRGSRGGELGTALHLVSAWHSAAGLVLGQLRTADKSNEITAIPALLDALDVRGASVSIDAMGCQRAIAEQIIDRGADYLLALKNNQPGLAQAVEGLFEGDAAEGRLERHDSVDKGHGRLETRECVVAHDLGALAEHTAPWRDLRSVVMVKSTREMLSGKHRGERSTEWRYYVSSLQLGAADFNARVRAHWGIENGCHWVLDVAFAEDDCRIRCGDGAQNFAILRRIALNLIKQERSGKSSVRTKRLKAGWSTDYLQTLLGLRPA